MKKIVLFLLVTMVIGLFYFPAIAVSETNEPAIWAADVYGNPILDDNSILLSN